MKKVILVLTFIFLPVLVSASTASDFTVNQQSIYDIPYGTAQVLVLDLTLPEPPDGQTYQLKSLNLYNAGTVDHTVISKLEIWEDGQSRGWDNDETEAARILQVPFFDTKISGSFKSYSKNDPWQRIFVTVDLESNFLDEKTLQLQLLKNSVVFTSSAATGPTDAEVTGFERIIRHDASLSTAPVSPIAKNGQALSASTIRWHFTDLSNNEFGFKILDGNLNEVTRKEEPNLSSLDETGLTPDTEYSGRRVVAFNDRGESLSSDLAVFSAVRTLALPVVEIIEEEKTTSTVEVVEKEVVKKEEIVPEKSLLETIQAKIAEIQQKIIELMNQLNELLKAQAAAFWRFLAGLWITLF